MDRDVATCVFQAIIDARLVREATNPQRTQVYTKGIYVLTSKGRHILQCYLKDNNLDDSRVRHLFAATQATQATLLQFERSEFDDHIVLSYATILITFRHLAVGLPLIIQNGDYTSSDAGDDNSRCEYWFSAVEAVQWLCDVAAITGVDEAGYVLAHFVRCGFVCLAKDQPKRDDPSPVVVAGKLGEPVAGASVRVLVNSIMCLFM